MGMRKKPVVAEEPKEPEIYPADRLVALTNALHDSRVKLQVFREQAREALIQYVGSNYGDEFRCEQRTTVNLMQLAIGIYKRQVAAREPRYSVTAFDSALVPFASDFEGSLNATIRNMGFKDSLDECVTQAMFTLGVMKHGIERGGESIADSKGTLHDAGRCFCDPVALDDFAFDLEASRWDKVRFAADAVDVSVESCEKRGWKVGKGERRKIDNESGDRKVVGLQKGGSAQMSVDDYLPSVRVWEIWLPFEGIVLTVLAEPGGGFLGAKPLQVKKWKGREAGPYRYLWFDKPMGNLYPVSPANSLVPLHKNANTAINKQVRQMEREKQLTVVPQGGEDDGTTVRDASDGEVVIIKGQAPMEAKYGGADAAGIAVFLQLKELFSYMGGNLDSIGGLARAANTVGQESLIGRGANARIASMQEKVYGFTADLGEDIAWYVFTNPGKGPRYMKKIAGTDYMVPSRFDIKEGDFEDYGVSIEPYSLQSQTPGEKVADIMEYLSAIAPFVPMLNSQGMTIDLEEVTGTVAKYKSLPELNRIIRKYTDEEKASVAQSSGGERPTQSPVTTRNNVRTNVSGTPGPGAAMELLKSIPSGGS